MSRDDGENQKHAGWRHMHGKGVGLDQRSEAAYHGTVIVSLRQRRGGSCGLAEEYEQQEKRQIQEPEVKACIAAKETERVCVYVCPPSHALLSARVVVPRTCLANKAELPLASGTNQQQPSHAAIAADAVCTIQFTATLRRAPPIAHSMHNSGRPNDSLQAFSLQDASHSFRPHSRPHALTRSSPASLPGLDLRLH